MDDPANPTVVNEPPWYVTDTPALPDSPRGGAGASLGGPASTMGVKPPKKGDEGQAVLASLIFFLIAITTGIGFYFFQKGGLPFNLGKKAAGGCCTYGGSPTGCAANESCVNDQAAATAAGCTYPYVCKTIVLTPTSSPIIPTSTPSPIPKGEQYPAGCCFNSGLGNYRSCPGGQACDIPNGACGSGGRSCNPEGSGYHKACVGDQCVNVPGGGVDECISHSECKVVIPTSTPTPVPKGEQYPAGCCFNSGLGNYRSCPSGQACNIPNGACGPGGRSCNPSSSGGFHKDWVNGQCVNVPGSGDDKCGLPTPTPKPSTPTPKTTTPTLTLIPTLRATPTPISTPKAAFLPLGASCSTHEQCGGYKGCGSNICGGNRCRRYICDIGVCGRQTDTGNTEFHTCQVGLHTPDKTICCPSTETDCNSYCRSLAATPTPVPKGEQYPAGCCFNSGLGNYRSCPSGQACNIPNGACGPGGRSCNPSSSGGFHKDWVNGQCVNVPGSGDDKCGLPTPTPKPSTPTPKTTTPTLTLIPTLRATPTPYGRLTPTPTLTPTVTPTPAPRGWTGKYCMSRYICAIGIPTRCSGCTNCTGILGFARCLDVIPTPVPGGNFPSPVLTSAPTPIPTVTPTPAPRGWTGKYCQSKAVCTLSIPPICSPCTSCSGFFGFARCLDVIPTPVPGGNFPSPVLTSAPIPTPTVTPTPSPKGWTGKYCQSKAVCTLSIPPRCSPCTSCSGFFGFARCLDIIPTPATSIPTPTPKAGFLPLGASCSTGEQCGEYKVCGSDSRICGDNRCRRFICDVGLCGRIGNLGDTEFHDCQESFHRPDDNLCCPHTEANCISYCRNLTATPTPASP